MDIDRSEIERRARAAFADGARELAFLEQNIEWLRRDYPDQFVAVHDGKVVTSSADLLALVDQLAKCGYTPPQVWIEFVEVTPRNLVL